MARTKVTTDDTAFNGEDVFVGLDVHRKSWQVTVRTLGMEVQTFSTSPCVQTLAEHLRRRYPGGSYHSVYEAGFCGFWIHRELVENGIDNIVIHAADVPTTNKEKLMKTDKIDSRKLARCLANGSLEALYVPALEQQGLRSLVRLRRACVCHQTRLKNRIKGHLYYYGIELDDSKIAKHWSAPFLAELDRLAEQPHPASACLKITLGELREQRGRLLGITQQLRRLCYCGCHAVTLRCLRSVPGVGFTTAATLLSEIIDINRFRSLDHLCSFVGLAPTCNSSGEQERHGGLSPRKNRNLKHLVIEAAWIAVRCDPDLTGAFARLCRRMRKTDAIIRIARKLLNRIRRVWKHQEPYRIQVPATA